MPNKKKARKTRPLPHPQEEIEEELPHPQIPKMLEKRELEPQPQSPVQFQDQQQVEEESQAQQPQEPPEVEEESQDQRPQEPLEVEEESQDQQPPHLEMVEETPDPQPSQQEMVEETPDQQPSQQEVVEEPQDQKPPQQEVVEEPQDMAGSPPRLPVHGTKAPPPASRKQKKRKILPERKRVAIQEKLNLLEQNLQPVPFAPGKTLDFSKHERLFRALGLWDFANLELDREIRSDLLALLIANYDSPNRCSLVSNARIAVSRADLARALSLPVKKEKYNPVDSKDSDHELFAEKESVAVMLDFMSNWMLFHGDTCILPGEVMAATQLVKEGQPQKVDWARLIWTMVEGELREVPKSGLCYYASHLQCLMRHQKPGIFKEVVEEEHSLEVPMVEEEEGAAACGAASVGNVEDLGCPDSEKQDAGLSLGMGGGVDLMEDHAVECNEEEQEQWLFSGKNEERAHCLQRCNTNDVQSMECEDVSKEGGNGIGEEESYDGGLASKFSLERLASTDLLQAMDTANISFCPEMQPIDPSSGEFFTSKANIIKSVDLNPCPGGSSLFETTGKREFGEIDDDADGDDDDDIAHFPHGDHQKRMRNDEPWSQMPLPFDTCMDQVQCWMGKAKMMFAEKEQECMNSQMQVQYLDNILIQKEHLIKSLEKSKLEEQHKRHEVLCQFEHELSVMARIVLGYKKALGETRHAFAEYRKKFPQGDEPLYKDVGGPGGIVLSTRELERQRLEREEMERSMAMQRINDFKSEWDAKFDDYANRYKNLVGREIILVQEYYRIKQMFSKNKVSDELTE